MQPSKSVLVALAERHGSNFLLEALSTYLSRAPSWLDWEMDVWNIARLHPNAKVKTYNIKFNEIAHAEMREIAKVYALLQIVENHLSPTAIKLSQQSFQLLGNVLGARPIITLKSEDFYNAQDKLSATRSPGTAARQGSDLFRLANWFTTYTGLKIDYRCRIYVPRSHGREATDEQREAKLLPDSVISDLLAAKLRDSLSDIDRFFLAAIAIAVASGARISELMTLPNDCLIYENGAMLLRLFTTKQGKSAPRLIPPEMAVMVEDAIEHIQHVTAPARKRAAEIAANPPLDWRAILSHNDTGPIKYFVRRWLAEWIANPENRLIDTEYAYYRPRGKTPCWVPIAVWIYEHRGSVLAISRNTGISRSIVDSLIAQLEASRRGEVYVGTKTAASRRAFDTDCRIPSEMAFSAYIGVGIAKSRHQAIIVRLIEEARVAQLEQQPFTAPDLDMSIEERFRARLDVLVDPATGQKLLDLQDALFVHFKNQFSWHHKTDTNTVVSVTSNQLIHWLIGYTRDRGTGKRTDGVCRRLGIIDPRTGEPAHITIHGFRHWLETAYQAGGLSQTQIATLRNRKSEKANSVYDQTKASVRRERLQDAMKQGLLIGHAAQAYARVARDSPEEAADYLEAALKFQNPMPHGICRLNWAVEPCPHHLSCFSCGEDNQGEPTECEHLIVDTTNEAQLKEIALINRNAKSVKKIMEEEMARASPQYTSFDRIERSTARILKRARDG